MSILKDLASICEADLQSLIDQPVFEDKTTEYKELLNLTGDEAKKKFLAGVASFANASGGDIIYGMKAVEGRPVQLQALPGFNPDQTVLTITDLVRAGIEPKIYGIGFQPVTLTMGGQVLIVRVPKTWAGAHMVSYNKDNRFYTRGAAGRVLMDVPEIRSAFSLAEATAERIRSFRLERVGNIMADETPVRLNNPARVVLHLCPLVSFEPGFRCDLQAVRNNRTVLKPMNAGGWAPAVDFDGDYAYTGASKPENEFGYSKLFRSGCIETVDAGALKETEINGKLVKIIPSGIFEKYIFEAVHDSLRVLKIAGVQPPLMLMLSFLNVRNYWMYVDPRWRGLGERAISRDNLIAPELLLESLDLDAAQVAKFMRPLFDSIWNACGWHGSINYDELGNWQMAR